MTVPKLTTKEALRALAHYFDFALNKYGKVVPNSKNLDDKFEVQTTLFEGLTTKEAVMKAAHYFQLDKKKVEFWIRQMELAEKI